MPNDKLDLTLYKCGRKVTLVRNTPHQSKGLIKMENQTYEIQAFGGDTDIDLNGKNQSWEEALGELLPCIYTFYSRIELSDNPDCVEMTDGAKIEIECSRPWDSPWENGTALATLICYEI